MSLGSTKKQQSNKIVKAYQQIGSFGQTVSWLLTLSRLVTANSVRPTSLDGIVSLCKKCLSIEILHKQSLYFEM